MTTDWAVPQQAKLKYTQLFNLHDRSRTGFLSGLQCRDILLQSGLPRNVLAEIWNLSDIDGDGQLTREEFILAMHLTNNVRSGQILPAELPPDLVPPSYRRNRSISQSSVHSATSAGTSVSGNNDLVDLTAATTSAGVTSTQKAPPETTPSTFASSVLNSNSFEDKRRENYEKGRAELERRRMKIIEQQANVLREQLTSGKKQITEAKTKIDAMRSERDTKMGMITSLEAQLQTLKERKAYLNHQELSLIALAKDLNVVDPAQAELDKLSVQAKQESLAQMKVQIDESNRENEDKSKELQTVTERLDELKKELKGVAETASKTYELYKEKVEEAKKMREKFVEESKFNAADFSSVWDSTPATNIITNPTSTTSTATIPPSSINDDIWSSKPPVEDQLATISLSNPSKPMKSSLDFSTTSSANTSSSAFAMDDGFSSKVLSSPTKSGASASYKAVFAFEARNPDELTINPGDIIIGSDHVCEPGWLFGETNGRSGLFPEAYVEIMETKVTEPALVPILKPASGPTSSAMAASSAPSQGSFNNLRYKVVYAFEARNPDELTINPGDIISGIDDVCEPGWLCGEIDDRKGLFPEAYVERISAEPSGKSRTKKAEVATVIANYRALGQEQLNLEKGQLVLIRRKMDSGWWEGEIQVKAVNGRRAFELDHLINELIETEAEFLDDLHLCNDAYISPLSMSFNLKDIFNNWSDLIQLHSACLAKLASFPSSGLGYSIVFGFFQDLLNSLVQPYTEFCSRQREASRFLELKLVSDIRFRQQVSECQRNLARTVQQQVASSASMATQASSANYARIVMNARLPLASFLLKPMQRITKYDLLFTRMTKAIDNEGPKELREVALTLANTARALCDQVNEACGVREDYEDNKRKLRWAQTHIMQQTNHDSTSEMSDRRHSNGSELASEKSDAQELIDFDSQTKLLGDRRLIKCGSLVKTKSMKELVAFLFNDFLLLTTVKGGSVLRVEDVFQSTRAQQSYYKPYRQAIMCESIVLQRTQQARLARYPSLEPVQNLKINFLDEATYTNYELAPLSSAEELSWSQCLSEWATRARDAKLRIMASPVAIRKPTPDQCFGRIFVTVLELNGMISITQAPQATPSPRTLGQTTTSSLPHITVEMQLKKSSPLDAERSQTILMSDVFKTNIYSIKSDGFQKISSTSFEYFEENLIEFNDECTQFLLERKKHPDGVYHLDISLLDDSKFKETIVIARRRINIDQLLGLDEALDKSITSDSLNTKRLESDVPTDLSFKLRPAGRSDPHRASLQGSPVKKIPFPGLKNFSGLSINIRFHLQLFS